MLGILLFQYYCRISSAAEFWLLLLLTTAASYYFEGPVLTTVSIAIIAIIVFIKRVHPFFAFLGTISYSLYLIHIPVGGRLINFAEVFIDNIYVRQILVFAALAVCIAAAYCFYILVERKFKNLSSKIDYKKTSVITTTTDAFAN